MCKRGGVSHEWSSASYIEPAKTIPTESDMTSNNSQDLNSHVSNHSCYIRDRKARIVDNVWFYYKVPVFYRPTMDDSTCRRIGIFRCTWMRQMKSSHAYSSKWKRNNILVDGAWAVLKRYWKRFQLGTCALDMVVVRLQSGRRSPDVTYTTKETSLLGVTGSSMKRSR